MIIAAGGGVDPDAAWATALTTRLNAVIARFFFEDRGG